jgi:hypothetical protein
MNTRMTLVLGLGTVLSVLAAFAVIGHAQGKSQEELRKPFVGTWRLVSIEGGAQNAANRGAKPTGIIMYDAHGLMNVQIMPDRPRPKYTAYWGTYTIDEKNQTVTHHRQGMLDAGIVDYVRKFELKDGGNRVVLTPVSGGTTNPPNHLTWERVR